MVICFTSDYDTLYIIQESSIERDDIKDPFTEVYELMIPLDSQIAFHFLKIEVQHGKKSNNVTL
jgi:hypothetical protein